MLWGRGKSGGAIESRIQRREHCEQVNAVAHRGLPWGFNLRKRAVTPRLLAINRVAFKRLFHCLQGLSNHFADSVGDLIWH